MRDYAPLNWRNGLERVGLDPNATKEQMTDALNQHDLEWGFIDAEGYDLVGQRRRSIVAEVWDGVDSPRPQDPAGYGWSDRSLDEALGKAIERHFAGR